MVMYPLVYSCYIPLCPQPHLHSGKGGVVSWAERSRRGLLKLARQCFTSALSRVGGARAWLYALVAAKAGVKLGRLPADTLPLLISVTNFDWSALMCCWFPWFQVAKQLSSGDVMPPASVELRGPWMTWVEVRFLQPLFLLRKCLFDNRCSTRSTAVLSNI